MHIIDLLIIGAFVGYAIVMGLRSRVIASKNLEEYFLAGRSLTGWKAGLSIAATTFAADTPLWITGLIATSGLFFVWRFWITITTALLVGFLIGACWRRVNVLTDAELTEVRYGKKPAALLRGFKAIYFGTVYNCTALAIILLAASRIAEPFLLWHQWLPAWLFNPAVQLVQWLGTPLTATYASHPDVWIYTANNLMSILLIVSITTFYSTTGGLRSVVNTDVVQFIIMMIATFLYTGIVIHHLGGLQTIPQHLETLFHAGGPNGMRPENILAFTPDLAHNVPLLALVVIGIQWAVTLGSDGSGYYAQRIMSCKTDKDVKIAVVILVIAQMFLRNMIWIPLALGLLILFPPDLTMAPDLLKAEREATFVRGMVELLPPGLLGLMLTGMLAALASTVDTHLNWGASYWTNDIYKRFVCTSWLKKEPSQTSLVWFARGANIALLLGALVVLTKLSSIQVAQLVVWLLGSGVGLMLILRWLWWRINAWGEITCILVSLAGAPILLSVFPQEQDALRLLLLASCSPLLGVIVSLLTGPETTECLQTFYKRAQPPGFWQPVATSLGEAPHSSLNRLTQGGLTVFLAALSTFTLFTAIGSLLAGSPPPTWFPWRPAWLLTLAIVGIGVIPIWWRLAFPSEEAPSHPS